MASSEQTSTGKLKITVKGGAYKDECVYRIIREPRVSMHPNTVMLQVGDEILTGQGIASDASKTGNSCSN